MATSSTTWVAKILVRHRRPSGSSRTNFVRTSTCWASCGKDNLGKFYGDFDEKSTDLGMSSLFTKNRDCSCRKTWIIWKWLEDSRIRLPRGRNWWNMWIWKNQLHFSIVYFLGCTQRECKSNESIIEKYAKNVSITYFCWSNSRHSRVRDTWRTNCRVALLHRSTCEKVRREVWRPDNKKWQNNCTQFQRLAWMITTWRRRSWKQSEKCPMCVHKLSWNACNWLELGDLAFFGP